MSPRTRKIPVIHAPNSMTVGAAKTLARGVRAAIRYGHPIIVEPGWDIQVIELDRPRRIRLAAAERGHA